MQLAFRSRHPSTSPLCLQHLSFWSLRRCFLLKRCLKYPNILIVLSLNSLQVLLRTLLWWVACIFRTCARHGNQWRNYTRKKSQLHVKLRSGEWRKLGEVGRRCEVGLHKPSTHFFAFGWVSSLQNVAMSPATQALGEVGRLNIKPLGPY